MLAQRNTRRNLLIIPVIAVIGVLLLVGVFAATSKGIVTLQAKDIGGDLVVGDHIVFQNRVSGSRPGIDIEAICRGTGTKLPSSQVRSETVYKWENDSFNQKYPDSWHALEGPTWLNGKLYFSRIAEGRGTGPGQSQLRTYDPATKKNALVAFDHGGNGISIDSTGNLITAHFKSGTIKRIKIDGSGNAKYETIVSGYGGNRFISPNDVTIGNDGTLYFTDPDKKIGTRGNQSIEASYAARPNGEVYRINPSPKKPNGAAVSPDGKVLYMADNSNKGDVRGEGLAAYDIINGTARNKRILYAANADNGNIDGLGMDCLGNIYIAGIRGISVISPQGKLLTTINANSPSNIAFGGPNNDQLYVTTTNVGNASLVKYDWPVKGYPY